MSALLRQGVSVNITRLGDADAHTPLIAAIAALQLDTVRVMLAVPGIDIDQPLTPPHGYSTTSSGSGSGVAQGTGQGSSQGSGLGLGSAGMKGNDNKQWEQCIGRTPLMHAAALGSEKLVLLLLTNQPKPADRFSVVQSVHRI
jgi:ankyrin repeat protein